MTDLEYIRRAPWWPAAIPPVLALFSIMSHPGHPVSVFISLTVLFGGLLYPLFIFLSLRWLRGRSLRAHWTFAALAPLLFGALYLATLVCWLLFRRDLDATDALGWAGLYAGISVLVGYVWLIAIAAARTHFVRRRGD